MSKRARAAVILASDLGSLSPGLAPAHATPANPTATGYLTVYPSGTTRPTASNLNFVAGQTTRTSSWSPSARPTP